MPGILQRLIGQQFTQRDSPDPNALPPLASLLKSREVEDPINLWLHRPLAYGFVSLIHRSRVTPNQVTFLAMTVGVAASVCWFRGGPAAMVLGGALLWLSAILDGADGILARAKRLSSPAGRALDGLADMVVGLATSAAALWHIARETALPVQAVLVTGIVAVVCTVFHMNLYDVYKELFLRSTRLGGGEGHDARAVAEANAVEVLRRAPWHVRLAMNFYVDYLGKQERFTARTNPYGRLLLGSQIPVDEASARVYRAHNSTPMRGWISISLAPHTYLFAIAGMLDLLLPYMVARLTVMNVMALLALISQRRASQATYLEYVELGLLPGAPSPAVATGEAQS